jgi:hypothetical protein
MYRIPKSTCGQGRKWCEPKICDAKDTTEFTSAADPDPDPQHWNLLCQNLVLKVVFNIFDRIRAQLMRIMIAKYFTLKQCCGSRMFIPDPDPQRCKMD